MISVPSEVNADVLEEKALNIFGKLGCDIPPENGLKPAIELAKKVQQ